MSLSRPNCFLPGINCHGSRKDAAATVSIATALHCGTGDKIDGAAKTLFQILLQFAHLEQADRCAGQKLNQQIDITAWMRQRARTRTK